jgi:rhamnogalacturonyl hydrolase YesR
MHARYFGRDLKLPHWSRANGWPIWAMTEVLTQLPPQHEHWGEILAHFRRHAEGLRRWQDKDGFWRNVLDRSDSAQEVSGTAIFVMALARGVTNGWLDPAVFSPVVERGWEAIESRIDADGTVHDICAGTMCSEDVEYYMNRPFYDNDTHGVFAVLFAGIAVDQMMSHSRNRGEARRNEKRIGNYAAV